MDEKDLLTKTLNGTLMSRRSFLKWSAALGGTAAVAGGMNLGLKAVEAANAESEGKWVTHACWFSGCGGRCLNKSYVVDGVVVRQKTDDTHPDSPDFPQQRGCLRGRSMRQFVFGADRLKYPMKRKNWAPGGGKKELRGRDEWVRISWDEALDIVASEVKRIVEKYGNQSILATPYIDLRNDAMFYDSALLNAYGGCWNTWGQQSQGGYPVIANKMQGIWGIGSLEANDRMDLRNSKLVVMWGANPAWASAGGPSYHFLQAKKAGAKFIFVDPFYNPSAQVLADEWISVRPGTDTALLLALAHHMIVNNLQDQEFLDKYTIGFDRSHMPEGADPRENFRDYVLGTYDHQPKSPEWASAICGVPVDTIRHLAIELATTKPATLRAGLAPSRVFRGPEFAQAFFTVGWMTGNVGISGGMVAAGGSGTQQSGDGGRPLVMPGKTGAQLPVNPICTPPRGGGKLGKGLYDPKEFYGIAYAEMWDAILTGEFTNFDYGKQPCDIQMIWKLNEGGRLNQTPNINKGIEAFRKVEFVVTADFFLTTDAKYSDVVLPASTWLERDHGVLGGGLGNREMLIYFQPVTQPLYESKPDNWIDRELAIRLDIDQDVVDPVSLKQIGYNQLAGAMVVTKDGSGFEPLVTITKEDLQEMGVDGTPQRGRISYQELKEKGVYQVERHPNDHYGYIAFKSFRDDPDANPLNTASGKLEIYCQSAADAIKRFGFTTISPIAKYRPSVEGYEDTFKDFDKRIKGEFPLQLVTPHYMRRCHSTFDNVQWLREAFPQELFLSTLDADSRGIKTGDTVLVKNEHGKVLRRVMVSDRVMPGVVLLGEGAWTEMDEEIGVDKAGNVNNITGAYRTGEGHVPFNTTIVEVEKWNGEPLEPDKNWAPRIPIKEA